MKIFLPFIIAAWFVCGETLEVLTVVQPTDFLFEDGEPFESETDDLKDEYLGLKLAQTYAIDVNADYKLEQIKTTIGTWKDKVQENEKVKAIIDGLEKQVTNLTKVDKNLDRLLKCAESVNKNWKGLTGGNAMDIAKSVVDIVGTVGGLAPPPVGTIISSVMGLASLILGIATSDDEPKKGVGEIVAEVINQELRAHQKMALETELKGAMESLELAQDSLNNFLGLNLTNEDYLFMLHTTFRSLTTIDLRGKLAGYITRNVNSLKKDEAQDAIDFIESYVLLNSAIELLLHTMKSILATHPGAINSAENIGGTIAKFTDQAKRLVQFLRRPSASNAVAFVLYNPKHEQITELFLDDLEIPTLPSPDFQERTSCYKIKGKSHSEYLSCFKSRRDSGCRFGNGNTNSEWYSIIEYKLRFRKAAPKKILEESTGDWWHIEDSVGWPMVMRDGYFTDWLERYQRGQDSAWRHPSSHFKFIPLFNGGHVIVNNAYNTTPLWMAKQGWLVVMDDKVHKAPQQYVFDVEKVNC